MNYVSPCCHRPIDTRLGLDLKKRDTCSCCGMEVKYEKEVKEGE